MAKNKQLIKYLVIMTVLAFMLPLNINAGISDLPDLKIDIDDGYLKKIDKGLSPVMYQEAELQFKVFLPKLKITDKSKYIFYFTPVVRKLESKMYMITLFSKVSTYDTDNIIGTHQRTYWFSSITTSAQPYEQLQNELNKYIISHIKQFALAWNKDLKEKKEAKKKGHGHGHGHSHGPGGHSH